MSIRDKDLASSIFSQIVEKVNQDPMTPSPIRTDAEWSIAVVNIHKEMLTTRRAKLETRFETVGLPRPDVLRVLQNMEEDGGLVTATIAAWGKLIIENLSDCDAEDVVPFLQVTQFTEALNTDAAALLVFLEKYIKECFFCLIDAKDSGELHQQILLALDRNLTLVGLDEYWVSNITHAVTRAEIAYLDMLGIKKG